MKKTMTFAILHFTTAFLVTYLVTGSLLVGGIVALIEPAVNTVVFYVHERLWSSRRFKMHFKRWRVALFSVFESYALR